MNCPLFHVDEKLKKDLPNLENPSSDIINDVAQLMYGEKLYSGDSENLSSQYTSRNIHSRHLIDQVTENKPCHINVNALRVKPSLCSDFEVQVRCADLSKPRSTDHIYEEIGIAADSPNNSKYDILDYYEKYSPTTAKMLIDTLFLPNNKICKICAAKETSVVYSDRLIRFNKPLYAKEVTLYQIENSLYFRYTNNMTFHSNFGRLHDDRDSENFIPVYNQRKSNTPGIFYSNNSSTEIFDLKSTTVTLVDNVFQGLADTELYHRNTTRYFNRIPANGFVPMVFNSDGNHFLQTIKSIGYETDLNWINYRKDAVKLRSSELPLSVIEPHPDRSSLLLLEPLLFMPDISNPRRKKAKNRITHSERLKIVRMMIAYTLAFFLVAIITFYIIYFS